MSEPVPGWLPAIGDRVRLAMTGERGTVMQLAPTEWGLLCDIQLDPPPGTSEPGGRRVHASTELLPLEKPDPLP